MSSLPVVLRVEDIPDRFFIDIAVGVNTFEELCAVHGLDPTVVEPLETHPLFEHRLALAKQAVEDDGRAFRARCRTIVNDAVPHMAQLMKDPETPPSTQLEAFKTLVKYGQLEPETTKHDGDGLPRLSLTIIAPDGTQLTAGVNTPPTPQLPAPRPPSRREKVVREIDDETASADQLGF